MSTPSPTPKTAKPLDPVVQDALEIPRVPSPYEGMKLRFPDHFKISAYWFATNFLWGAMLTIMLPDEMKQMFPQFRVMALSVLTALSAIVALVVPLVVGALSDRSAHPFGRRRPFMLVGVAINVLGLAGMAVAFNSSAPMPAPSGGNPGFWQTLTLLLSSSTSLAFIASYLVVQFGNNVASAAYSGMIPDLVPEDQRGAASGYMALMSQFGTLMGAVGCGELLKHATENAKYGVVSLVLVGVALITILGVREIPLPSKPPKIQWGSYARSLWIDPKKYPDFAWVWITRAMVMLGFYAILPFINYYLTDVIGIENPGGAAAELIGIILIASSISGVYGGYVSDKIGRKKVVYIANVTIAVMALSFIFCRNLEQVILAGVLFGLGFGAYTSVDWALGTDVLPNKKDAAKEMGVWHVAMTLPQTLSAPIAGYLISLPGQTSTMKDGEVIKHYTITGYSYVFVLCAVCFALGAYLLRNVRGVR